MFSHSTPPSIEALSVNNRIYYTQECEYKILYKIKSNEINLGDVTRFDEKFPMFDPG